VGAETTKGRKLLILAFLVHSTGRVQSLPDMTRGRRACGLCVCRGAVHVFGSIGCAAGERLAVQTGELLDMHTARWNFNATVWKGAIFLCQGSVDVFDGHNKLSAGLILPEGWNTISYACGKSLLILSKSHFMVLEMRENRPAIVRKETHREASVASHPTPVLFMGAIDRA